MNFLCLNYLALFFSLVFILTVYIWIKFSYFAWSKFVKQRSGALFNKPIIFKLKIIFAFLGFTSLYLASLGVAYPINEKKLKVGHDALILLDVSRSMLAEDCAGKTRLQAAINTINQIVDQNVFGTIGVMLFAKDFFMLAPATEDKLLIKSLVNSLDNNFVVSGHTTIKPALNEAIRVLSLVNGNKSIIVLSDGEFEEDLSPEIKNLLDNKIIVHSCLFGTEIGAPICEFNTEGKVIGHLKKDNDIVLSCASSKLIKNLSNSTLGNFWKYDDYGLLNKLGSDNIVDNNIASSGIVLNSISWIFSCIAFFAFVLERFL